MKNSNKFETILIAFLSVVALSVLVAATTPFNNFHLPTITPTNQQKNTNNTSLSTESNVATSSNSSQSQSVSQSSDNSSTSSSLTSASNAEDSSQNASVNSSTNNAEPNTTYMAANAKELPLTGEADGYYMAGAGLIGFSAIGYLALKKQLKKI